MVLAETLNGQRREQATDQRGVPKSYGRAMAALDGACAHCSQRAVVSNGAGVGLCSAHQRMRVDAIGERNRLRRKIEVMRRG
jgi:hypothetical protein